MKVLKFILSITAILLTTEAVNAAVAFDDNFNGPVLASEWQISPGKGAYSLTANPGYLRYTIDAFRTSRTEGFDQFGNHYDKVLWLVHPFDGNHWLLRTALTFDLRPGQPTNNRLMYFTVREPGANGTWIASVGRWVGVNDTNPFSNALVLFTGDPTDLQTSVILPNSPGALPPDSWYFEMERNADHVVIRASNDGDNSTFEYVHDHTFPPGFLMNGPQEIEIQGSGWQGSNNPPGYVDFDYINLQTTCPSITITQQPISQVVSIGQNATFTVSAIGSMPLHYRWRFNGEFLTNGGHYSGVDTNTLLVQYATPIEVGIYEVWIMDGWECLLGKVSDPATLTLGRSGLWSDRGQ